jgi:hypothetical protein
MLLLFAAPSGRLAYEGKSNVVRGMDPEMHAVEVVRSPFLSFYSVNFTLLQAC